MIFGYTISVKNLSGIAIAVCGLMYYSYIKLNEATVQNASTDAMDSGEPKTVKLSSAGDLGK